MTAATPLNLKSTVAESATLVPSPAASAGRHRRLILLLRLAILVAGLAAWEASARTHLIDSFAFSSPSGIAHQLWTWTAEGTAQGPLWRQLFVTMEETVIGFAIGSVSGIAMGLLLGCSPLLSEVLSIYIKVANAIPRIVLGSVFIIAFGLGIGSKIALAVIMVFFVVFANAFQGVREADRFMIINAEILGASRRQVITSVILPSAMTWIAASLHVSFGLALIGAVVGEFLGAREGLGLLIATAQGAFNADGVFAAMVILAMLALLVEYGLSAAERRLVRWKPASMHEND